MKRRALALLVGGVLVMGACDDDEAMRVTRHDRRQFHVVMEGKLRQIDRGIEQVSDAATGADSAYVADVESLRRSQRDLRERLSAMGAASDQNWPALKDSLEFYYRDVRTHFDDLARRDAGAASAQLDSSSVEPSVSKAAQTN
jgi:hypothetical protein